jgi:hypothetical protein
MLHYSFTALIEQPQQPADTLTREAVEYSMEQTIDLFNNSCAAILLRLMARVISPKMLSIRKYVCAFGLHPASQIRGNLACP